MGSICGNAYPLLLFTMSNTLCLLNNVFKTVIIVFSTSMVVRVHEIQILR